MSLKYEPASEPLHISVNGGDIGDDDFVEARQHLPNRIFSMNNHFTEICSGSEAGSYLRLIDSCITQLKAQGPSTPAPTTPPLFNE